MKNGGTLVMIAIAGVALWMWSKGKGFTPSAQAAITTSGKSPSSAPAPTGWQFISEVPPPDVKLYSLGPVSYAKFEQPIIIGDTGFKQWGVTAEGSPVVSLNPPESYDYSDWM